MKIPAALAATLAALLFTCTLQAQVPQLLNYQGRVAVNGVNFDGTGQFKFALVNAVGATTYWSNDGTSTAGSQPTAAVTIAVSKGLYSVLLGNSALPNMTAIPTSVFANADVKLRVWFNDGTNGSQLITPDQPIAAVGYAMRSATAAVAGYAGSAGTVYGDASAGDYTAPSGEANLEVSNPQFNNFTVPFGATLHVPSGLTIRCANTFTNNGTVIVDPVGGPQSWTELPTANRGIARRNPALGFNYNTHSISVSAGGKAYAGAQLKTLFSIGMEGGGRGGTSPGDPYPISGLGGGSLRVIARGLLNNAGTVRVKGQNGSPGNTNSFIAGGGGGGGGVVILASGTSLIQSGTLDASGGRGGADGVNDNSSVGPGGGGGGGFIRLLSPVVASSGQNNVLAGVRQDVLTAQFMQVGAPGGASAGDGAGFGSGGVLEDAGDGLVLIDLCNPAGLLGN